MLNNDGAGPHVAPEGEYEQRPVEYVVSTSITTVVGRFSSWEEAQEVVRRLQGEERL